MVGGPGRRPHRAACPSRGGGAWVDRPTRHGGRHRPKARPSASAGPSARSWASRSTGCGARSGGAGGQRWAGSAGAWVEASWSARWPRSPSIRSRTDRSSSTIGAMRSSSRCHMSARASFPGVVGRAEVSRVPARPGAHHRSVPGRDVRWWKAGRSVELSLDQGRAALAGPRTGPGGALARPGEAVTAGAGPPGCSCPAAGAEPARAAARVRPAAAPRRRGGRARRGPRPPWGRPVRGAAATGTPRRPHHGPATGRGSPDEGKSCPRPSVSPTGALTCASGAGESLSPGGGPTAAPPPRRWPPRTTRWCPPRSGGRRTSR